MDKPRKNCSVKNCSRFVRDDCECKKQIDLSTYKKPQRVSKKLYDDRRGNSTERGYDYKWQQASKGYRAKHPLYEFCERIGFTTLADVVDHIKPFKSYDVIAGKLVTDDELKWDRDNNWQGLCHHHHNKDKQAIEDRWRKGLLSDVALRGIGWKISNPKA
ncbi:MAG: hypothetical protein HRU28_12620 [Rhizobiales bacterium]|nr:hypothetical protein [Hyphomicrobiales bacterium]